MVQSHRDAAKRCQIRQWINIHQISSQSRPVTLYDAASKFTSPHESRTNPVTDLKQDFIEDRTMEKKCGVLIYERRHTNETKRPLIPQHGARLHKYFLFCYHELIHQYRPLSIIIQFTVCGSTWRHGSI
jgi:hypothetical protein